MSYRLVQLVNGTWSVHSDAHDETFHPVVGPAEEAERLYVRQLDIQARFRREGGHLSIWDVGLGAAANPLTLLKSLLDQPGSLSITSFDHTLEPLEFALGRVGELPWLAGFEPLLLTLMREGQVRHTFPSGLALDWRFLPGDFPTLIASPAADALPKPHAILFDAFSPATNPAMWTLPLFRSLFSRLDPARPCAMPTYSRSTLLRVTLLLAGFHVGRGDSTGEKEETTLAASHASLISRPLDAAWLRKVRNSTSAEPMVEPAYRQAPLSQASLEALLRHPQFALAAA